jgi:hypothetical protein
MRGLVFYIVACVIAVVMSYLPWPAGLPDEQSEFPGWPSEYEGRDLRSLDVSQRERAFEAQFPGKIAKFTDGNRMIIMRWVTRPTRKLHPASDCFKAVGYRVRPNNIKVDDHGNAWGSFRGTRSGESLLVYERIHDSTGGKWTDVSSWYWAAILGRTSGPWWAVTLIESDSDLAGKSSSGPMNQKYEMAAGKTEKGLIK